MYWKKLLVSRYNFGFLFNVQLFTKAFLIWIIFCTDVFVEDNIHKYLNTIWFCVVSIDINTHYWLPHISTYVQKAISQQGHKSDPFFIFFWTLIFFPWKFVVWKWLFLVWYWLVLIGSVMFVFWHDGQQTHAKCCTVPLRLWQRYCL